MSPRSGFPGSYITYALYLVASHCLRQHLTVGRMDEQRVVEHPLGLTRPLEVLRAEDGKKSCPPADSLDDYSYVLLTTGAGSSVGNQAIIFFVIQGSGYPCGYETSLEASHEGVLQNGTKKHASVERMSVEDAGVDAACEYGACNRFK